MSQVLVTEQYLEDIADAIRAKNGSENTYTPAQMANAISELDINEGGDEGGDEVKFQYVVNLNSGNSISLKTIGAKKIDWGDQNVTEIQELLSEVTSTHQYNETGQHTIGIYGEIGGVGISSGGGFVTNIPMALPDSVYNLRYLLYMCYNIKALPTRFFNNITKPILDIAFAFTSFPISHLDLSPLDLRMSIGKRQSCIGGNTLKTVKLGPNGNIFDGSDFVFTGYGYSGRILRDGVPYTLADAIALNNVAGTWSRGEQISNLEIKDTWETIIGYINEGTAAQHYQIGQWKTLNIKNSSHVAQLVAFNADDLADGSGKAKTSWICRTSAFAHRFNPAYEAGAVGTGALGGWGESELRTYLVETVLPTIQQSVKDAIKEVIKRTNIIDANGQSQNNVETIDSIWIPSERELKGTGETQGADYAQFHSWAGITRYINGGSYKINYWIRTSSGTDSQKYVPASENISFSAANNNNNVILGFCL